MKQIIKQLQFIKETIEIDNEEVIALVVEKLSRSDLSDEVLSILSKLDKREYLSALEAIDDFIVQHKEESLIEVSHLKKLRDELKSLEEELKRVTQEKNETLNLIDEFNTQYSLKLGDLIRKVLSLKRGVPYRQVVDKVKEFHRIKEMYQEKKEEYEKLKAYKDRLELQIDNTDEFDDDYDEIYEKLVETKEKLYQTDDRLEQIREKIKASKDNIKKDPAHREYQESTQEYHEFKEEQDETVTDDRYDITDEEKHELKATFRRAVKLCHPDIVSEQFKEQAQSIIQELNHAYKKYDIKSVNEILHSLENSIKFALDSDTIDNQEILRFKISTIKNKIKEISIDIDDLKGDETYTTISTIDDWDAYFTEIQDTLKEEYERLKNELLEGF